MFSIEVINFLQSFDHPIVFGLMWFISILGTTPSIIVFTLIVAFGLDLKRGLVLINIVAWTAFVCMILQYQVELPFRTEIDSTARLSMNGGYPISSVDDLIPTIGFPSAQTAIQTSMWLSFLMLFRKRWILNFGLAAIILTSLSNIFLGQHYLGDVVGGILLGALIPMLLLAYINKSKYLSMQTHDSWSLSFFWLPWIALPLVSFFPYWQMASVLGMNMAVIFIVQRRNFPVFHVIPWKRVLATVLLIVSFLATFYINKYIDFTSARGIDFMIITLLNFIVVLGVLSLSRRLFLIKYRLAF